jgi:hypothetical protein
MRCAAALSLTLCMNVAVVVTLVGQVASQGMISPFPAWPPDGNIPEMLQNNYVFLGPRMGEIVVSYPAVLDNPNQTGRRTFTFELHNQVEPTFTVQMAQGSNGVYAYDYLLRNGRSAKQSIRTWSFVGPVNDAGFSVSRQGWSGTKTPTARLQQIALPNVSQAGAAVTFYAGAVNEIAAPSMFSVSHRRTPQDSQRRSSRVVQCSIFLRSCPRQLETKSVFSPDLSGTAGSSCSSARGLPLAFPRRPLRPIFISALAV